MIKVCKHCGELFETNNPQKIYCNRPHYRPCPICGKPVKMIDNDFSRAPKCCSTECAMKKRQKKFKPRKCEICGEEFIPSSGCQKVCSKQHTRPCVICGKPIPWLHKNDEKVTCSDKCLDIYLKKRNLERYGVDHPMKLPEVRAKQQKTMEERYGVKHALQSKALITKAENSNLERYGTPYFCTTDKCRDNLTENCNAISKINQSFAKRLDDLGLTTTFEYKLDNKYFDIAIEDTNILVEIDPTYTHSAVPTHMCPGLDRYYHRDKSKLAECHDKHCIHIFDWDDWDQIIPILLPKTKLYARKCAIYRIKPQVGDKFLEENHLQGTCRGQMLYLGLVYEDELVQLMTFGKSRYNKNYDIELLRLCTKQGISVIGGASKLFKYATKMYELSSIISYCDAAKFDGTVYTKIGMKYHHATPPQEIWSKRSDKITANLLRQRGFDQLFGTNYGKGTDNNELMIEHGWLPVYDCGQKVFIYEA